MNSLKQVIVNAVLKVSTDPLYAGREYVSAQDAREDFIKALIAELFPESPECMLPSAVHASEEIEGGGQIAEPAKKKRAPKAKKAAPVAAGAAEPVAEPVAEPEKKKPGRKPKEPAAAGAAEPEKKKVGRKPKETPNGPQNLDKWNPAQTNHFKAIAKEMKVDGDKKAFQAHVNAMSKEEFEATTFDDHVRRFLTPPVVVEEVTLTKCARVEWLGETYLVDPDTQKVYKPETDGNKHVGHVGMLEFEGMEIPSA